MFPPKIVGPSNLTKLLKVDCLQDVLPAVPRTMGLREWWYVRVQVDSDTINSQIRCVSTRHVKKKSTLSKTYIISDKLIGTCAPSIQVSLVIS